jgi:hypothetical protein
MKTKTKTKKSSRVRGNPETTHAKPSDNHSSTNQTKESSGTTRADYEDEDAAIERAAK